MTSNGLATDVARSDPIGGLMLNGPGSSTSSIGILVGQSTTTQVAQFDMTLSSVTQFGVGLQQASNSYSYRFHGGLVNYCGIGAYFPSGLSNNAEIVEFHGVTFSANTTASLRSYGNSLDILVVGGSFDYDTGVNIDLAGDTIVQVVGTHFEFASAKQVAKNVASSGNPILNLTNCTFTLGGAPSTTPVIDGSQLTVIINGGWFRINASGTQTTFLLSNGNGGSPVVYYQAVVRNLGLVFQSGATLTNIINGIGTNSNAYLEYGATKSEFYGLNGSFYSDQTVAISLYWLLEKTRLGAMIRAGVDDMQMARAVGIPASKLFTTVFCLGAGLAGLGGTLGGPIFNAYPGLDADMLPLALIVVILGGVGSLVGTFIASFLVGFIYNFGLVLVPDLAYVVLFLPMVIVIAFKPMGLFGTIRT